MTLEELDELVARYAGQAVPTSYNVGFVVLSYVVSLLGAGSTLELINRRTSIKGLYNHFLLVSAAVSMGGIAIWSMHFIANRAIILLDGEPQVQIAYSTAITVASFFVPILVLLLAFVAVNYHNSEVQWWRVVLSGFLSGGAICGMHYLGDAAISNYRCRYVTANVVGAAVIAVTASTVALSMFFVFRAAWTNSWLRRMGCMVLLAGAVSGMHWCASLGTRFVLLDTAVGEGESGSRNTTTIVVICLAAAASVILVVISVISARTMKNYAIKAQQVVLAVAVFDRHGRILVSPDGLLPSEKVTETFPQKSHDDVFTTAHPLFHWMFRASRNWSSICTLLPWMMSHLDSLPRTIHRGRSGTRLFEENGQLVENYEIIFRELFCLAAETLATRMAENIQDVGRLWGEIFHTGTETRTAIRMSETFDVMTSKATENVEEAKDPGQLERGYSQRSEGYGRGSLMFLVRHIDSPSEVARLEAAGYRFAETHRVIEIIRSSMQIKTRRLEEKLRDMARHSDHDGMLTPGVHVGLFAVRARLDKFGFDVMVEHGTRNALPTVKLPSLQLGSWQIELLKQVESLPLQTLLIRLAMYEGQPREVEFANQLRGAIKKLRDDVDDSSIDCAVLSSKLVEVPCLQPNTGASTTCTLVTLQAVLDINTRVHSQRCNFIPLQFFKVHQMVQDNSPHQAAFSRALHREMSTILTAYPSPQTAASPRQARRTMSHSSSIANLYRPQDSMSARSQSSGRASPTLDEEKGEASSSSAGPSAASAAAAAGKMAGFGSAPLTSSSSNPAKPTLFGGIMVSQEIAIEVAEAPKEHTRSPISGRLNFPSRTRGTLRKGAMRLGSSDAASAAGSAGKSLAAGTKSAPGGASGTSPIEMGRVKTPSSGILLGKNGFDFNVEAFEKDQEVTTFVDELFASCVESIRA